MKLVCSQADLSFNLSLVNRAVPSRPTGHPILANVLLTADMGTQRVGLTSFDLSMGIRTSFPATVHNSGAITLPAKLLTDIVTKLPPQTEITLEQADGDTLVNLTCSSGRYQVRGMGAEEFPDLPLVESGEAVHLSAEAIVEGLRGTLFAASGDETKQVLTGVHLSVQPDTLEFAATDGHRLAVVETVNKNPGAVDQPSVVEAFEVTVPGRALRDLERLIASCSADDAISLYFDQGQTVFQWADQYLTSRTLDGQYPNYRQLIPKQFERQVTIERKLFLAALDRIAVLADQKNNHVVKLLLDSADQRVLLSVEAQDVGSGQESVPAQVSGESLEIAFNVRYLMDGLKALPANEVQLQVNNASSPVILTPLGAITMTYLVMPVQIRN
jgi:DNA polymerase-3 subunit beta